KELADERVLEKLEIERQYWARRGVPWLLVTEEELPQELIANLSFLAPFRSIDGYGVEPGEVPEVLSYLYDKLAASPSVAPGKVCAMADERLHFKHGVCLALVWHAIATKQWRVDLDTKLDAGAPLQGLSPGNGGPELLARIA
ncbi:MAG TPA: TnsA endonuclease C-terminal domain-containing protein, partial [Myxococcaceae bacterium]|nr:TnsA endonuclease C-terminal domain-containing protein [Myxococcaceae bacterium]